MKKHISYFSFLFFIATGVSILRIVFSAATSTAGIELTDIQAKEARLEEENIQLSQTVYKLTSLTTIAEKAKQMGFIENKKSAIFVGTSIPFALKQ